MQTFITAYLVIWLAMLLYVARIGVRQRRLQQTLDALQRRLNQHAEENTSHSKAA